jgi:benzoate transport
MTGTAQASGSPGAALDLRKQHMTPFQVVVVAVCVMICMIDGYDVLAVAFTSSHIVTEWGLGPRQLGLLFSGGLAGMCLGALVLSPLADRFGRRPIILGGLVLITVGMLLSAVAPGFLQFLFLRFVTGLGVGALLASANTLVAEYSSDRWRSFALSTFATGYPIGATLGGFLAVALTESFGWRSVFVVGGLLSGLLIPLILWRVPESLDFLIERRPPQALEKANRLARRLNIPPFAVLPEPRAGGERSRMALLFSRDFYRRTLLICTAYFMVLVTIYFFLNWTPRIMVGMGIADASAVTGSVMINLGGAIGGIAFGLFAIRWNPMLLTAIFFIFAFIFMMVFALSGSSLLWLLALAFVSGFFLFAGSVGLYSIVASIYPTGVRATGTGMALAIGRLGAVVGPYGAGVFISYGWSRPLYFLVLTLPLVIAALAVWLIRRTVAEDGIVR